MHVRTVVFLGAISTAFGFTGLSPGRGQAEPARAAAPPAVLESLDPAWCPLEGDVGPGLHGLWVEHDGMTRSYELHVPDSYDGSVPVPLVVSFHGYASDPAEHAALSGLDDVAGLMGFIVAYPSGFAGTWNAGRCCGAAAFADVDDVGYVVEVMRDVSRRACIDPDRIYLTGVSNGGDMADRVAWERPGLVAAVATAQSQVPGTLLLTSAPVPAIVFQAEEPALDAWDALSPTPAADDAAWRIWDFLSYYRLP
jgi:poly(3-hydroxybutyrate) depolymerase